MSSNVIDIKTKKPREEAKLHVDHMTGRLTGSPHLRRPEADNFDDRMQRIKANLEKINTLMNELRKTTRKNKDD